MISATDLPARLALPNYSAVEVLSRGHRTTVYRAVEKATQQLVTIKVLALETILGSQPPAPALSGSAAQNRFDLVFQAFIQVFTTPERPLVIFVDDLQWADSASLNLIRALMAKGRSQTIRSPVVKPALT